MPLPVAALSTCWRISPGTKRRRLTQPYTRSLSSQESRVPSAASGSARHWLSQRAIGFCNQRCVGEDHGYSPVTVRCCESWRISHEIPRHSPKTPYVTWESRPGSIGYSSIPHGPRAPPPALGHPGTGCQSLRLSTEGPVALDP